MLSKSHPRPFSTTVPDLPIITENVLTRSNSEPYLHSWDYDEDAKMWSQNMPQDVMEVLNSLKVSSNNQQSPMDIILDKLSKAIEENNSRLVLRLIHQFNLCYSLDPDQYEELLNMPSKIKPSPSFKKKVKRKRMDLKDKRPKSHVIKKTEISGEDSISDDDQLSPLYELLQKDIKKQHRRNVSKSVTISPTWEKEETPKRYKDSTNYSQRGQSSSKIKTTPKDKKKDKKKSDKIKSPKNTPKSLLKKKKKMDDISETIPHTHSMPNVLTKMSMPESDQKNLKKKNWAKNFSRTKKKGKETLGTSEIDSPTHSPYNNGKSPNSLSGYMMRTDDEAKSREENSLLSPELGRSLVFESPLSSTQIGQGTLVAGSIQALLIYVLENVVYQNNDQLKSFLLAHRQFTTPIDLMKDILSIFYQANTKPDDEKYKIQLRVAKLLCQWFVINFSDFQDPAVMDCVKNLLNDLQNNEDPAQKGWAALISKDWQRASAALAQKSKIFPSEPPVLSKKIMDLQENWKKLNKSDYQTLSMLDFTPEELAKQMSIKDHKYFSEIPIEEFSRCNFMNPENSPKLSTMNQHFNKVSKWMCTEIATTPHLKQRIKTLTHCVLIAEKLRKLQNWNGLLAVVSGLSLFPSTRLKQTWKSIPPPLLTKFKQCETLITPLGNFKNLREVYAAAECPQIPPITMVLKDLTFIEDGNPDWIGDKDEHIFNFSKLELLGKVISQLQKCQIVPYPMSSVDIIQEYLDNVFYLDSIEDLETHSKIIEPSTNESSL